MAPKVLVIEDREYVRQVMVAVLVDASSSDRGKSWTRTTLAKTGIFTRRRDTPCLVGEYFGLTASASPVSVWRAAPGPRTRVSPRRGECAVASFELARSWSLPVSRADVVLLPVEAPAMDRAGTLALLDEFARRCEPERRGPCASRLSPW